MRREAVPVGGVPDRTISSEGKAALKKVSARVIKSSGIAEKSLLSRVDEAVHVRVGRAVDTGRLAIVPVSDRDTALIANDDAVLLLGA